MKKRGKKTLNIKRRTFTKPDKELRRDSRGENHALLVFRKNRNYGTKKNEGSPERRGGFLDTGCSKRKNSSRREGKKEGDQVRVWSIFHMRKCFAWEKRMTKED